MMKSTRSLQRGSGGSNDGASLYENRLALAVSFGVIVAVVALLLFCSATMGESCHSRMIERLLRSSSKRSKKMALKKIRKGVVVKVRK